MIGLDKILSIGEKVLDRVIPDPAAAAQAKLELAKQAKEGALKELEAVFKDIDSARDREAEIVTSEAAPLLNKIVTPILALGTVGLSFALFGVLIFTEITEASKDILIYVLGAVNSASTMVLAYYFGSSVGSKDKTEELKRIMK